MLAFMRSMTSILLVILPFISACQEAEESPILPSTGIIGSWQGVQKFQLAGEESFQDVRLELSQDSQFELRILDNGKTASGFFELYEQLQSLTLRFSASEIPELVPVGAVYDFEYRLFDSELELSSNNFGFKLKRKLEESQEQKIVGQWNCVQEGQETLWELQISSQILLLFATSSEGASLFLRAELVYEGVKADQDADDSESSVASPRIARYRVSQAEPVKPFDQMELSFEEGEDGSFGLSWIAQTVNPETAAIENIEPAFSCQKT